MEKEIIDFARSIAPRNWQFIRYCNLEDIIYKPGVFYIEVGFYDSCNEDFHGRGEDAVGFAKHITLRPISFFTSFASSNAAYKKHGEFLVASSAIHLDRTFLDKDTMLHEMAHLAASRMIMSRLCVHRHDFPLLNHIAHEKDYDMHGAIFQKAYRILIERAVRAYGKEDFKVNIAELEMYQRFEGQGQKNC